MKTAVQRASTAVLFGVLVFVVLVAGVLLIKARFTPASRDVSPGQADYRFKEIRLQEQGPGKAQWRLAADQAEIFEGEGRTVLRKVTITIEEPERTWTVTSDEGHLMEPSKDVELRKNVVLLGNDGFRLETETLRWQARERRVWTTAPVTVLRRGVVVRGQGLDAWVSEERTRVTGHVRAIFSREGERAP